MMKRAVQEALLIIILAIVIALVVNALRPAGIPLFNDNETRIISSQGLIAEIDINEAMLQFKTQTVLFVDARSSDDYFQGDI